MSAPAVRAVVVTHDSGAHVARCLESLARAGAELAAARGEELEVVVVDNASRDGTALLARATLPGARVLEPGTNLGFGAGVNLGARDASARSVFLLNPDAWLEPGALPRLVARLEAEPRAALVAPRLVFPDGTPQTGWGPGGGLLAEALQRARTRRRGAWLARPRVERVARALVPGWFSGAALLVRREAFEAVRGFDEGFFLYFEDVDLCTRLRRSGWRLACEEDACVVHVGGASWSERAAREYRRSQLRYYALHRPRWEQRLLRSYLRRRLGAAELAELGG